MKSVYPLKLFSCFIVVLTVAALVAASSFIVAPSLAQSHSCPLVQSDELPGQPSSYKMTCKSGGEGKTAAFEAHIVELEKQIEQERMDCVIMLNRTQEQQASMATDIT